MADDNDDTPPDNVIPFGPRYEVDLECDGAELADALLEDCIGEYVDCIIIGLASDGEMVVSGSLPDVAEVYEILSSAAQNIAMAHINMLHEDTEH